MTALDSSLVKALDLGDAASEFARGAVKRGLAPPSRFGTEVVARLLGLRTNHPTGQDSLELLPKDPATRAEAAFSAARILDFGDWELAACARRGHDVRASGPTSSQRQILRIAVSFIGYPYVWGGTSEKPQTPLGVKTPGGFDCSGFVWRVYKLQTYADAPQLNERPPRQDDDADERRGRRRASGSRSTSSSRQTSSSSAAGPKSKPAQVNHTGIYLGNGWFIHSSGYGVALARLDGWYASGFAWARRPLIRGGARRSARDPPYW